jgi:hypothetical protein
MKRTVAIALLAIVTLLLLGGLVWRLVKVHGENATKRENPVEYYVLHTTLTRRGKISEDRSVCRARRGQSIFQKLHTDELGNGQLRFEFQPGQFCRRSLHTQR